METLYIQHPMYAQLHNQLMMHPQKICLGIQFGLRHHILLKQNKYRTCRMCLKHFSHWIQSCIH